MQKNMLEVSFGRHTTSSGLIMFLMTSLSQIQLEEKISQANQLVLVRNTTLTYLLSLVLVYDSFYRHCDVICIVNINKLRRAFKLEKQTC